MLSISHSRQMTGKQLSSLVIDIGCWFLDCRYLAASGEGAEIFMSKFEHSSPFSFKMAGFVDDTIKPFLNGHYLGNIDELDNVSRIRYF